MLERLKGKLSVLAKGTNKKIALFLAMTFVAASCTGFAKEATGVITITDTEGAPVQVRTTDVNVGKILSKQGIILNEGDRVNYALTDKVASDAVISIVRAMMVNISYMGETKSYLTTEKYVSRILAEQGIEIDADDVVSPSLSSKVDEGATINVTVYDRHNVTVQEEVAFETKEILNTNLAENERVIVQAGEKGINEYVYSISYKNGVETARRLVKSETLSTPVEEIVECGPKSVWELGAIPASAPTNYSRVEIFNATAYDASPADNGIWAGKTSTGMPLVYGVVAVDPRVIPYGTKMYIESVDGQFKYGYAIAGDCGGAIKGKKVDLFFPSRSTCYSFGRRPVKIYFLD